MTINKQIRLATVGTGYFSQFQYAAWARIPEIQLVGICSHDSESLSSTSKQFETATAFTDFEKM